MQKVVWGAPSFWIWPAWKVHWKSSKRWGCSRRIFAWRRWFVSYDELAREADIGRLLLAPVFRCQVLEDRWQKTEDRGQKTEDQRTDDRGQNSEY